MSEFAVFCRQKQLKKIWIYGNIILLVLHKGLYALLIVYCDNEPLYLEAFSNEFSDIFEEDELLLYTSAECIFNDISNNIFPDIILMDIDLGDIMNGIDYAEEFLKLSPNTKIIYVTAYIDRFIHELFLKNSNVPGFLAKPVRREYLLTMLEKVRKQIRDDHPKMVAVSFQNIISKVDEKDILYVESDRHLIKIVTEDKTYVSYEKLSDFKQKLSASFALSHKSFLVNMDKIKNINSTEIILENDAAIPVSRSKFRECKELYLEYLKRDLLTK